MQLAPVTATYCVEALVLSQVALSHGTALQSRSAGLEAENRSAGDLIGLGPRGIVYRATLRILSETPPQHAPGNEPSSFQKEFS